MDIKLPFSTTGTNLHLDKSMDYEILESGIKNMPNEGAEDDIVLKALANPISSKRLSELSKGKENIVIICSDHTRPVPSKKIIPHMLKEIRDGNPNAKITLLIATGFHRLTTKEELINKFGEEIVNKEKIVIHDSTKIEDMKDLGKLPSGASLLINKVGADADLLVSEGFIETHFFAGFSGGRKSIFPGIASRVTVLGNHCSKFINSPYCRTGILEHNPIHEDMKAACRIAKLAFIVNVIIDSKKRVVHCVAGDALIAHETGCKFLQQYCEVVPKKKADICISTNGGYPLDQNFYQAVKGMTAAEAACKDDGLIIMVANCEDGHGGEDFYQTLKANAKDPKKLMEEILKLPQDHTKPDQWEYQIQTRIRIKHKVIFVCCEKSQQMARDIGFFTAKDVNEALKMAIEEKGKNAHISIIPDGVSVMIKQPKA